ncbi:hypothetical protein J2X66_006011 [Pseudomonas sp. 3296]|nr:hypothetical protein [Pseudomonas sp. 3296]
MSRLSKSLLSAVMLFACVTMRTVTSWDGEPSTMSYGFPLPWYTPSLATSLAYTIAVVPLLLDFFIYFVICWGLASLVEVKRAMAPNFGRVCAGLRWIGGIASVGVLTLIMLMGDQFTAWTLDNYFGEGATRSRHVHLFWAR